MTIIKLAFCALAFIVVFRIAVTILIWMLVNRLESRRSLNAARRKSHDPR